VSKEPIFESILEHDHTGFTYYRRHVSSLDFRLLALFFGSLIVVLLVIATGFAMIGAWFVIPFAGLEIAALATAVFVILRRAGDFESIAFRGDRIQVDVCEHGLARRFEFHRSWARLVHCGSGAMALRSHGKTVEVGRYCDEADRQVLTRELRSRLGAGGI